MSGRPARVVILNDAVQARGGATALALLSARLLRADGIPVTYISGDDGASPELRAQGVEVIGLNQPSLAQRSPVVALRGLSNGEAARQVAAQIRRLDAPGVVYHLHAWAHLLSPSVLGALAPVAKRTVLHAHDFFLTCPNGAFMDFQAGEVCLRRPLSRSCLTTHCDKHSRAEKLWRVLRSTRVQQHLKTGFAAIALVHPGMRAPFLRSGISPRALTVVRNPATPLGPARIAAEDNNGIVFIGRISIEKGVAQAAAAARLAGVPFTALGDGPLRHELAATYPEAAFPGWLPRDALYHHAAQARALVMPSLYPEPFGLVAAEASLSGLPVILSDAALLAEEIADHGLGLRIDPRDPAGLARAFVDITTRPRTEIERMSRRGHADVAALATTETAWRDALLALYAALIATTS